MYIDTHAHVHDKAFDQDREAVLERMRGAGVEQAVLVGCDLADSRRALECARASGLFASAGIHPHEAKDAPPGLQAHLEQLCEDPRVKAVGETGLDYYYDHSPQDAQQRVLREQIAFAKRRGLPVIFHHRDAYDDFVAILRDEWEPGMRGVVHCFTGDSRQANTYTGEFGLSLGIGGVITFNSAGSIREAVRATDLRHLVLETDCPYLAPAPHRGKRNEPSFLPFTAQRLAELLELPIERVREATSENARALFDLSTA